MPSNFPFPSVFDNTILSSARACPQKFVWAYCHNLATSDVSVHLHAGAAFARGLEITRKAHYLQGASKDDALAIGALALIESYGDFKPHDKEAKSLDNMLGAMGHYFLQWPLGEGPEPVLFKDGKRGIEWNFALPIPGVKHPQTGEDIIYCGRFDTIDDYNGMKMGGDDKTTTQLGDQWFNRWRLANQITGYCWGAAEYGMPLAGFRLRGISILKNSYGHAEAITYRKSWQIKEFLANTQATIKHLIQMWEEGYWEKAWNDACSSYGGCQYIILCESQTPEQWIPVNFVPRTWDPLRTRD